jgi:hypothetical protein
MRRIFALLMLLSFAACDPFTEVKARFAVYNRSPDPFILLVNAKEFGDRVEPNQATPVRVEVPIPSRDYGSTSPLDESVSVTVAIRNLRTGYISQVETCRAGAKVITTVIYTKDVLSNSAWGNSDSIRCESSY